MKQQVKILFGKRVRERRLALGMTQQELADHAGLHRSYIGEIELGGRNVSLENIAKIAAALNIGIGSLLEDN